METVIVRLETREEWDLLIEYLESKGDDWSRNDSKEAFTPGITIKYDLNDVKTSSWTRTETIDAISFKE